jgi:hypothetical protein
VYVDSPPFNLSGTTILEIPVSRISVMRTSLITRNP